MLSFRASLAFALFAGLAASTTFGAATVHHHASTTAHHASTTRHRASAVSSHASTSSTHGKRHGRKGSSRAVRPRGQQAIEPARVTEIQQALIREHY
ncbi:MAG TPA: hypothetical protein VMQ76_00605, partial [Terracidiphilus sp.]|nr:hypothetical protein [Terracidiphilus sp.]